MKTLRVPSWRRGMAVKLAAVALLMPASVQPVAAAPPEFKLPVPVEYTLDNGLRVVVFEDRRQPVVRIQLLVPAGVSAEAADEGGVAHFTARMLHRGTSLRSAARFARDIQDLGSTLATTANRDYTTISAGFLAADFEAGFELLADAALNPTFSNDEIGRMRFDVTRTLTELHSNTISTAEEQVWLAALPGHPYGRPPVGTVGSIVGLARDQLEAFHRRYYRPRGSLLAVAGDVKPEAVLAAVKTHMGAWAGSSDPVSAQPLPPRQRSIRIRIVDLPANDRTELRVALRAPERGAPDYEAVHLANRLFGESEASQLARRGVLSGTFGGARSDYRALRDAGLVLIRAAAWTDSAVAAVRMLQNELRQFHDSPPGDEAIRRARRVIRNTWPFDLETSGGLVARWCQEDFHGFGDELLKGHEDALNGVTAADLERAIQKWFDPAHVTILAVGPAERLRPQFEALGDVEVMQISNTLDIPWASGEPTEENRERGRQLIAQAIDAHGGAKKLNDIKDASTEGFVTLGTEGRQIRGEIRVGRKDPYKMVEFTRVLVYVSELVLDQDRGWLREGQGRTVMQADSLQVATMRSNFESDMPHLLRLASAGDALVAHRGRESMDGRAVDLIQVVPAGGGSQRWLLLDAESHRLVGLDVRGGYPPQVLARRVFSDFREVDGVLWPHVEERWIQDQRVMRIEVNSVTLNAGLSDGLFVAPIDRQ